MSDLSKTLHRRISIMVYRDPGAAHQFLTDVFGFSPGEVITDEDGRAVHAEVTAGDGAIWLHPENSDFSLSSPLTVGAATASMAVLVDHVDEHHAQVRAKNGDILYAPVDQPYGYREYSVRDYGGHLWSFMEINR